VGEVNLLLLFIIRIICVFSLILSSFLYFIVHMQLSSACP